MAVLHSPDAWLVSGKTIRRLFAEGAS